MQADTTWDRFAGWERWPARILLALVAILVAFSAVVPISASRGHPHATPPTVAAALKKHPNERPRDADLALYDRVIERVANGDNYYRVVAEEHRAQRYPLRPAMAVRLPTLAFAEAAVGVPGEIVAAILLLALTLIAWWRRLAEEPGAARYRLVAMALLLTNASLGLNRTFFVMHELWAGMLLALAFGLHRPRSATRPGRYLGALIAAALALAIREHSLPFVLLMAAMAAWRRDWREAAAWSALVVIFALALSWHLQQVTAVTLPTDVRSAPWIALRGLSGFLSNTVLSGSLRFLPHWIAGPVVILTMLGWAGWRSPAGALGTLFYGGYGTAFMIAGRPENYYWGVMIVPALLIGLAFAPRALVSLVRAARRDGPQSAISSIG
ncbi:hypothetical protein ACFO0A_03280 [Novosphingobium tardum]|uniref:Glycosyltransferase RgtA/B/C/D-like domain-containing protein n=1 Tax=Novosphingobium tardum TaxID=1538021 RepID=A0ABV8RL15_9SPHN